MGERRERPYINVTVETMLRPARVWVDELAASAGTDGGAAVDDLRELPDEIARVARVLKEEIRELNSFVECLRGHIASASRVEDLEEVLSALWGDGAELMPPWWVLCDSFGQTHGHVRMARWGLRDLVASVATNVMSQTLPACSEEELQKAWEGIPRQEDVFIRRDPAREGEIFVVDLQRVVSAGLIQMGRRLELMLKVRRVLRLRLFQSQWRLNCEGADVGTWGCALR